MYLTVKQQLKGLSKTEYNILRELCHIAKNMTNVALYNIRQEYIHNDKFLNYNKNYKLCKKNENYKILNSNMAQQIIKEVDSSFKSFFALIKKAKSEKDKKLIRIPKYLPKDGYTALVIGFVRIEENKLRLPYSNLYKKTNKPILITIPPVLKDRPIREIRIIPKCKARYFEIQYTYEVSDITQNKLNTQKALAIDLGISNLATCVTNEGKTFIVDGRRLKSINQWFNKKNAKLQSEKDLRKITGTTRNQYLLRNKRNNRVNDYITKTCRKIINYCIQNDIGNIVLGYNVDIQRNVNIGKVNNQNFVNIPLGKIKDKLDYMCKLAGIEFKLQEESYTSKASFFDNDDIPIQKDSDKYIFNGERIKRGLYKTKKGYILNADVNGALNILKKSKVVSLTALYNRGEVDAPVRIRIS